VSSPILNASKFSLLLLLLCATAQAQEPTTKPADTAPPIEKATLAKNEEKPALPFQIQLLETHIRFEANGDSRKEVHTIVKINDPAGARQFARLGFDYNRAFQQVEIPLVKISHANGGTSEILPSAITDAPNPAVQNFPAYHDVRVKSVRILGLQDGDTIEYRVITTTTKHPLAPDFWLEHTFDRSGQVVEERYELDLPEKPNVEPKINPATAPQVSVITNDEERRKLYRWERKIPGEALGHYNGSEGGDAQPDVTLSTFGHWRNMSVKLADALTPGAVPPDPRASREEQFRQISEFPKVEASIQNKADELTKLVELDSEKRRAIYEFVSGKIVTVDLPLGATGFSVHTAAQTLSVGYGTQEDKFALFNALAKAARMGARPLLTGFCDYEASATPRPSVFTHLDIVAGGYWLDPSLEVAPFGMIMPVKEKCALVLSRGNYIGLQKLSEIDSSLLLWKSPPRGLPFAAFQKVSVEASITAEGTLKAKLKYLTRGDNELVQRMAFHQTPKERWKEVAGLLALSDGFRGTITNVTASDPMATKDPFTVEYEITQPKFVDWSKKPVRIPALLPQIALPDAPGKEAKKIELGTPLDVQTSLMLKLPEGTAVQTPAATSVTRDYAEFASKYDAHLNTVSVSRHINFLKRELPVDRAPDYNAFLRAVQNDQSQMLVLVPPDTAGKSKIEK
jgi:Domain of Unknown Function with PDB structure (DUF3857)